jgi:preprotein translocase subunit Sec61beta
MNLGLVAVVLNIFLAVQTRQMEDVHAGCSAQSIVGAGVVGLVSEDEFNEISLDPNTVGIYRHCKAVSIPHTYITRECSS